MYDIADVTAAPFIIPRNPQTKALLITFNSPTTPDYLDIPGEPRETRVYPIKLKPMRCYNCLQYGHTKSLCSKATRCQQCTQEGHEKSNCPNNVECLYCEEKHETGSRDCSRQVKEQSILDIQDKLKIGKMRARQILEEDTHHSYTNYNPVTQNSYATHFVLKLDNEDKRSINPFLVQRSLTLQLGSKPESIRGRGNEFTIKVTNKNQSETFNPSNN